MKIFVNLKQIGKKKNSIDKKEYEIKDDIQNIEDLIKAFVRIEVEEFNKRADNLKLIDFLTNEQISDNSEVGKISFNEDYNTKKQDLNKAIENALLSYQDGIYCIFLNEERLTDSLKQEICLKDEDSLTFVRLTMLAGRMW